MLFESFPIKPSILCITGINGFAKVIFINSFSNNFDASFMRTQCEATLTFNLTHLLAPAFLHSSAAICAES